MPRMPKRPDYGYATPEDLARALVRAGKPRAAKPAKPATERRRASAPERERPGQADQDCETGAACVNGFCLDIKGTFRESFRVGTESAPGA